MKACLICDDHALVREALAGTVRLGWPEARITTVNDFPAAWAAAAGHDCCIADLMMPGADPAAGIARLMHAAPDMDVLVVTGTQDDGLLLELLDLGIAGFAPKTASGAIIEAALRLIDAGGRYLPARLADIAAARFAPQAAPPPVSEPSPGGPLSERQLMVLRLAANGRSNKEIALSLGLSPATIKSHLALVQAVLGARNRTDAAGRARALGLI
ncbi:MAG: response regulator transcription factor [Caulobacteraceae bacterium]